MVRRLVLAAVVAGAMALVAPATAANADAGPGNSGAAHACQQGGYLSLVGADGTTFSNVGECVSFAAHGGKFATGIIIPAGETATLTKATFGDFVTNCPADALTYGYQLNLGANVQLGSHPINSGCAAAPGATIGPFPTATLLRVWLDDLTSPAYIFYSDGSHALVSGSNPFVVAIMDSFFGTSGPSSPRVPPGPGEGNLNVTVTIS